jgi:8-oxoguanine deaminase
LAHRRGGLDVLGLTVTTSNIDAVLADTERLADELHELGPGARVQLAVAPCSPFSVTGRLMEESAALARRLGLPLHTHLAETVEEIAGFPNAAVDRIVPERQA